MAKLKSNFIEFHNFIKLSKHETPDKVTEKRDNIKNSILTNLKNEYKSAFNEDLKEINFIHQGSYSIDTVINANTYDIDYGVIITPHDNFDINGDTSLLKNAVLNSIKAPNRVPEINKPCISITYTTQGEEDFHLDFPVYIKKDSLFYYLAWGKPTQAKEERVYKEADPIELNKWFKDFLSEKNNLSEQQKQEKRQTRRLIRYLKYWKFLNYSNLRNTKETPPSIALTILVCENYIPQYVDNKLCDLTTLHYIIDKIWNSLFFEISEEYFNQCYLPVTPYTDTFYKFRKNKTNVKQFRSMLKNLANTLKAAIDEPSLEKASEFLANEKILGENFPLSEESTKANMKGDSFA